MFWNLAEFLVVSSKSKNIFWQIADSCINLQTLKMEVAPRSPHNESKGHIKSHGFMLHGFYTVCSTNSEIQQHAQLE